MPNISLGERIKELRLASNVSLRTFATRIGKSPAFLSDIELGRRYPSSEVLEVIAKELRVEAAELDKLDTRGSIDDMKRLIQKDPSWGFAFRTVADSALNMTPQELINRLTREKDSS